uniref:Melatonin receptor 1B n=1 Tax=Ailuropoda melanoleuca TaxID=9646 RepID=A0A7N5JTA8_AILME
RTARPRSSSTFPSGSPGSRPGWGAGGALQASRTGGAWLRPSWVAYTLAFILIFTIVVDVLGNLLVILSVYRNKKLRNAGRSSRGRAAPHVHLMAASPLSGCFP